MGIFEPETPPTHTMARVLLLQAVKNLRGSDMLLSLHNPQQALENALLQTEGQFDSVHDRARVMHYLLNEQSFDIGAYDRRRKYSQGKG